MFITAHFLFFSSSSIEICASGRDEITSMDEDGPRFIQEPPALLEFTNQTGATVWCAATGHPQPTVMWISASELATTTTAGTTLLMEMAGLRRMTGGTSQNISLVFPPFAASSYRPDVHSTAYRCRATSPIGTILSREMRLRAGNSKFSFLKKFGIFFKKENFEFLQF